jgi:hypothetical protein
MSQRSEKPKKPVASHRGALDFICIESWSTKKRILQRFQRSRYSYWYNRYTTKAPHYEDAVRVYIRRIRIGYRVISQGKLSTFPRWRCWVDRQLRMSLVPYTIGTLTLFQVVVDALDP